MAVFAESRKSEQVTPMRSITIGLFLVLTVFAVSGCEVPVTSDVSVFHRGGLDCYDCHGVEGIEFGLGTYEKNSVAGTVFMSAAGTDPAPGIQVKAIPNSGGTYIEALSDHNGNFIIRDLDPDGLYSFIISDGNRSQSSHIGPDQLGLDNDRLSCNSAGCHDIMRHLYP